MTVTVQWGSEIRPFKIWKHLKSRLFEGEISNGLVFKWFWLSNGRALARPIVIVPTIRKLDHSKSGHFCPDFKWFLTKWGPVVCYQTVGLPDFRSHLKSGPFATQPLFDHIQASLDFRSILVFKCIHCSVSYPNTWGSEYNKHMSTALLLVHY